jgi:hypothetical protein
MGENLRAFAALVGRLLAERWYRTCPNAAQKGGLSCRADNARFQGEAVNIECLPRTTSKKPTALRPEDSNQ